MTTTRGVVIVDRHEPHGEVAGRLLELAEEKGYDARVVEAQRGEHDAPLSFRVPKDVAEAFDSDRSSRWPDRADENADRPRPAALNEDAYAADDRRVAAEAATNNASDATEADDHTAPRRTQRPGKQQEKPKE